MKTLKNATVEELQDELNERMLAAERAKKKAQETRALQIQKMTKEGLDLFVPEHGRTSCSDKNLANGLQFLPPRCTRCALLQVIDGADWPRGHELFVNIQEATW